jgi:DNA-binding response OmpR family regulator
VTRPRILLLESDKRLREILLLTLEAYDVNAVGTTPAADEAMRKDSYDLALVDLAGRGHALEGIQLIKDWRTAGEHCPIIAVSGAPDVHMAAVTLRAGADDFMRKPIRGAELLARIERRMKHGGEPAPSRKVAGVYLDDTAFRFGGATIHPDLTIRFGARTARLLPKQLGILRCFHRNRGELVLKQDLLREVWGPLANAGSASVHEYISRLRRMYAAHGHDLNRLVSQMKKVGWRVRAVARKS